MEAHVCPFLRWDWQYNRQKSKGATNRAWNTKILLTWHELSRCRISYPKTCVACATWNSCHVSHSCLCLVVVFFLEHFLQGLVVPRKERIDVSKKEQTLRRKHWGICALSRKNVIGISKCWKGALDRGVQTPNALRRSLHEAQKIQDLQQCPIFSSFLKGEV